MESMTKVFGSEHPDTLDVMRTYSLVLQPRGKWEEAKELSERVLDISSVRLGPDDPDTLTSLHSLAMVCQGLYWSQ